MCSNPELKKGINNAEQEISIVETPEKQEKQAAQPQKTIKNTSQEDTIAIIYRLREQKMSFGQMERYSGINAASIFQIKSRKWWPQKEARQQEIYEKMKSVEIGLAKIKGGENGAHP
jgi:hypothetical protein